MSSEVQSGVDASAVEDGTEVLLQTEWKCLRDGVPATLVITDVGLEILPDPDHAKSRKKKASDSCERFSLPWLDVLGVEEQAGKVREVESCLVLHHIHRQPSGQWRPAHTCLTFPSATQDGLVKLLTSRCHKGKPSRLLVIINPISGHKTAPKVYRQRIAPVFKLASVQTEVIVTNGPDHAVEITNKQDLSAFDGIVVVGGDGMYHQALNGLVRRTQEDAGIDLNQSGVVLQPPSLPIGVIPCGTGNGIADAAFGVIDPVTAALHIIRGQTADFNVLSIHYHNGKLISLAGLLVGYGGWAQLIKKTEQNRWLGVMRYPVVILGSALKKKKLMRCCVEYLNPEDAQNSRIRGKSEAAGTNVQDFQWKKLDLEDGLLTDIISFASNVEDKEGKLVFTAASDSFVALIDKPTGWMNSLKSFVSMMKKESGFLKMENKVVPPNLQAWRLKSLLQELQLSAGQPGSEAGTAAAAASSSTATPAGEALLEDYLMANVDGESVQLEKPELEVWLHPRCIPVFSSRNLAGDMEG